MRQARRWHGTYGDAHIASWKQIKLKNSWIDVDDMRILLANQPRLYREVIGDAFYALRPQHDVVTVAPEHLDDEVVRLAPQLVFCSQLTLAVQVHPLAWVMLYPEGKPHAVICLSGRCRTVADLELSDLLAIIDRTERMAQLHGS